MVSSFLQESKTSKRTGASLLEKRLQNSVVRPSLLRDLLFVCEFIDFMISSKDIFALQRLNFSLDGFFLLGILLRNSVVAALEVVS